MKRPEYLLLCIIFTVLTILSPLCVMMTEAAQHREGNTYRDIPGITEEERVAIAALQEKYPEGITYGMMNSTEAFIKEDGEIGGFADSLCEWLSAFFDVKVTPVICDWDELLAGLHNGSVDLTGELTASPERLKTYNMTTSIAERTLMLFYWRDHVGIDLINSDETMQYVFLEGSTTYDLVLSLSELSFQPVFARTIAEAAQMLRDGEADAFIGESTMELLMDTYSGIECQEYYPVLYTDVSLSTANPDMEVVIDVVQKYLVDSGTEDIYEMYQEGRNEYLRHCFRKNLSAAEKEYIDNHVENNIPIRLLAEFDNYPISFYNKEEQQWQGIAHDILAEVTSLSDLTFQVVNSSDESWGMMLEALEDNQADMITNLISTKDRKQRFLWTDKPYCEDNYALISRAEEAEMNITQVRHARVGLISGTAYEEAFYRLFPDHENTVVYRDSISTFEALGAGEIDLAMMPCNLLLSITHYMEKPDYKVNISLSIPCDSYFGFYTEQEILKSIIDKAQENIEYNQIADRWKRKVFDYNRKMEQERILYWTGISLLLFTVLLLVIVLFRKREDKIRTIGMTDYLTQLPNKRAYDAQLKMAWEWTIRQRCYISLLTIDIDYFKKYNDTYGHPQGDVLLKKFGEILKDTLMRPSDMAMRIGGEEFAVILPNTDESGAVRVAEKIRERMEKTRIKNKTDNTLTQITVSIGVASMKPTPQDDIEKFCFLSDQALYMAKEKGRNQVCCGPR